MWHELKGDLQAAFLDLDAEVAPFKGLIQEMRNKQPDHTQTMALAAMLHSLYTGMEGVLKRIHRLRGGSAPRRDTWHSDLLLASSQSSGALRAPVSPALALRLKEYLRFRHRFRQGYGHELNWELLRPLVLGVEELLAQFKAETMAWVDEQISDAL